MAEWKRNEDGNIAIDENQNPIWVHDDNTESGWNVPAQLASTKDVVEKNKALKADIANYEKELKKFEGIDPEKSRKALETILNIDEGKLIEAGKRDEAVKKAIEAENLRIQGEIDSYKNSIEEMNQNLESQKATIFNLMVSKEYAQNEFLRDKTTMTPDVADALFSKKHFKIEDVDGVKQPVGYLNGEKLYSNKIPGKIAQFDEAFQQIWENYQHKNNYLKDVPGGAGSTGGHGRADSKNVYLNTTQMKNVQTFREALERATKQGGKVLPSGS